MLCFYFILLFIWSANASFRYDYQYSRFAKGWLKLHRVPATFNEAFFRCELEGAVLASPSDEGLLEALKIKHPKVGLHNQVFTRLYVGIHATISKGDYTTIEGIPLDRIPVEWAAGEPRDYSEDEGCLIMLDNGSLAGVRCNETYPFVCYKKKTSVMVMNECGTVDAEYSLDKRTGSCYKFHRDSTTWRNAYSICLAEGGYLVIINNANEMEVIRGILEKNPEDKVIGSKTTVQTSVGVLDWGKTGHWFTVHGQKLQDIGFTWASGQPDNSTSNDPTGEHCVSLMRKTMVYNDIPCDIISFAFICEKDPQSLLSDDEL